MPLSSPSREQMAADVEAWNRYARRMNQKALERGLVTAEQLQQDRQATQAALAQLKARLGQA